MERRPDPRPERQARGRHRGQQRAGPGRRELSSPATEPTSCSHAATSARAKPPPPTSPPTPGSRSPRSGLWSWPASTRCASSPLSSRHRKLDLLINNAGIMQTPPQQDGRRLRAPVRHQPPRPLRPHRAAARRARSERIRAHRHREQQRAQGRPHRLRRPPVQSATTARAAPTSSRSSPTPPSGSSSTAACARPGRRSSACSRTRATPPPTSRAPARPASPRR